MIRSRPAGPATRRTLVIASIATVAVVAVSGVATAAFVVVGGGFGTGEVAEVKPLQVQPASLVNGSAVLPGGTGDVSIEVKNPNVFDVDVAFAADGSIATDPATCDPAHFTFIQPAESIRIGAGTNERITLPDALALSVDAGNECSAATVTIPLAVAGSQVVAGATTPSPTLPPGPPMLDVVLVVDDSESMWKEVTVLMTQGESIVDQLTLHGRDVLFGLVAFAGSDTGNPETITLLDDPDHYPAALKQLNAYDVGGPITPGMSALDLAMSEAMRHREKATTCVVLISDAGVVGDGAKQAYAAADQLTRADAQLSVIVVPATDRGAYTGLAEYTGGVAMDISTAGGAAVAESVLALVEACIAG